MVEKSKKNFYIIMYEKMKQKLHFPSFPHRAEMNYKWEIESDIHNQN